MTAEAAPSSYLRVEQLHLRQWVLRAVPPIAALATNGAGWLDVPTLPRHDAAARALGLPAAAETACIAAGAALIAGSAVLRVLAKGVLVRKSTVTIAGAYSLVRHPFYLATLAGAVGVLLLSGSLGPVAAAAWLAVALPIFLVTIAGEEAGLRALHGPAWDAYAARIPRLVPRPWPARGAPGPVAPGAWAARVTWANLVTEGEPPRLLRFLAGAVAVLACRLGGTAGTGLLLVAGLAFASSHVVARSSRRRAR